MCLRLQLTFLLIVNASAQSVTLSADTTDVSAGSIHLTCNHGKHLNASWWRNGEIVLAAKVTGGGCTFSPTVVPAYLADCACTNTEHTCTLQSLSRSNVGDQWACSVRTLIGAIQKSNILILTARRNDALITEIACSLGGAVGGIIIIVIVVIIMKRRKHGYSKMIDNPKSKTDGDSDRNRDNDIGSDALCDIVNSSINNDTIDDLK
ncbi:uncharacterized protein LOC127834469 isoform X2 [Dreissena polymorpha]|uniref:uncharacterized protein LOC127834469 isoform X2 n=1 Tax=Dreissena polymorpha TaxID=45954 RepID=UPI00226512E3|nr:uncharacterized protein LOC127834469 isoform X2 [Dreissena polymorpha]